MLKRTLIKKGYKKYFDKRKNKFKRCSELEHKSLTLKEINRLRKQGYCHTAYQIEWYDNKDWGPEQVCWIDPYEEGIWDMFEGDVRKELIKLLRKYKPYLKNPDRIVFYENYNWNNPEEKYLSIYIFLTDTKYKCDIWIFLSKNPNDWLI